MSKTALLLLILFTTLCASGCSTIGVVEPDTSNEDTEFYIQVHIPPHLRASGVAAQSMTSLAAMIFRVRNASDPTIVLDQEVTVEPDQDEVIAAFRLGEGDWYLEVAGLNDDGVIFLRDKKSLDYWRDYRTGSWRSYQEEAFPDFISSDAFAANPIPDVEIVTIAEGAINYKDDVAIDFEPGYAVIVLDINSGNNQWTYREGSWIRFEQPGRELPYQYSGSGSGSDFAFNDRIYFQHLPTGGWTINVNLEVKQGDNESTLRASEFVEIHAGESKTIRFSGGNMNVVIGGDN